MTAFFLFKSMCVSMCGHLFLFKRAETKCFFSPVSLVLLVSTYIIPFYIILLRSRARMTLDLLLIL